jgi:hypothetical protein
VVSAMISGAGIYGGMWVRSALRRILPSRMEAIIGVYLCVLAVRMLMMDAA